MFQVDDSQRGNQGNRFLTLGGGWVSQVLLQASFRGRKLYSYRGFKQRTQTWLLENTLFNSDRVMFERHLCIRMAVI